jgi:hypothetical protein
LNKKRALREIIKRQFSKNSNSDLNEENELSNGDAYIKSMTKARLDNI